MTIDELLNNLKNKFFHGSGAFSSKKLTSAERIIRESEWTDFLQSLADWGNNYMLENFRLGMAMEYNVGEQEEH